MRFLNFRETCRKAGVLALLVTLGGCGAAPDSDTDDVARLAALDVSAALQLINGDTNCGFESPGVIASQELSSMPGTDGTVTRRVRDCLIDLSASSGAWPYFKCDGEAGTARGKIRFSGSRTITGRLMDPMKSPKTPVIPSGAEPLKLTIDRLQFDNFDINRRDKAGHLTLVDGAVSGSAQILLAAGRADGFCSAPTPNATIENLSFENTHARFTNLLKTRDYAIGGSKLDAVNGSILGRENELAGTITLDGAEVQVPSGKKGFDPDYDRSKFQQSYACDNSDLQLPVTTNCPDINRQIAENSARLAGATLANVIALLADDKKCGFSSDAVLSSATTVGSPGESGTVTFHVEGCTLDFLKNAQTAPDCLEHSETLSGRVTLSGTRTVKGVLTGDPKNPVIPESDGAVEFDLTSGTFEDFSMANETRVLQIKSGSLTGKEQGRVAQSTQFGVCSVPTKIAYISDVELANADVHFGAVNGGIDGYIEKSRIFGVNGIWKGQENVLWGDITTGGEEVHIGSEAPIAFDTSYRKESFDASWQCDQRLAQPVSFECGTELPLPESAARLSVAALGALSNLIENDTQCGFASTTVRQAAQMSKGLGEPDTTGTFTVSGCRKTFAAETVVATDCNGKKTSMQGTITFRATKTMSGYNTGSLATPILPTRRDAVQFDVTAELSDFTFTMPAKDGSVTRLIVDAGTLQGRVAPRLALDKTIKVCSKATPVTTFTGVNLQSTAPIELELGGTRFVNTVSAMNIAAQNGAKDGISNRMDGSLTFNGEPYTFPIRGSSDFDPDFEPQVFQSSYMCDQALEIPENDQACDYKLELAHNAARSLILAMGATSGILNEDANCGLNLAEAQRDPNTVRRLDNPPSATWLAPPRGGGTCNSVLGNTTVQDRHCGKKTTYLGGTLRMSASLLVRGRIASQNGTAYVNPTSPDAPTDYNFNLSFQNLHAADMKPDGKRILSIDVPSGTLTAAFHPIMGRRDDARFTYLSPTPILRIDNITLSGGPALIGIGDMTLKANLSNVAIKAFSGTYNGASNSLAGSIGVDGQTYTLSGPLDPEFNQQNFDQGYACRPGLQRVVPTRFP